VGSIYILYYYLTCTWKHATHFQVAKLHEHNQQLMVVWVETNKPNVAYFWMKCCLFLNQMLPNFEPNVAYFWTKCCPVFGHCKNWFVSFHWRNVCEIKLLQFRVSPYGGVVVFLSWSFESDAKVDLIWRRWRAR